MQFVRKKRRSPVINIISMIDILVVLLIFYIVTTVFKKDQPMVKIAIPSSTRAAATQTVPPEIIYYTADRKLYLESKPIELKELGEILKQKLSANPSYKVALKVDTDLPTGEFVKIMDAAHEAGLQDLPMFVAKAPETGGTP